MSIRAKVRAQALDDRVRFERNYPVDSGAGGFVDDWRTVKECYARVDGAKASSPEPVADGGIRTPRDYTVWIRADIFIRYTITPLDRVRWRERIMNIADIPDQGQKGGLIAVICRAGMNQG